MRNISRHKIPQPVVVEVVEVPRWWAHDDLPWIVAISGPFPSQSIPHATVLAFILSSKRSPIEADHAGEPQPIGRGRSAFQPRPAVIVSRRALRSAEPESPL
jgi:hypothetical protein